MKPAFQNYAERGYLYFLAVVEYGSRARPTEGFASGYSSSVGYGKTRLEGSSIPNPFTWRDSDIIDLRFIAAARLRAVTVPDAHGTIWTSCRARPVIRSARFGKQAQCEAPQCQAPLLYSTLIKLGDNGETNAERPSLGLGFDPPKEAIRDVPPESGEGRWLFVFDDIGVIEIGRYLLHFTLVRVPGQHDPPPPLIKSAVTNFQWWPLNNGRSTRNHTDKSFMVDD
ncbi:hypothetical protein MJO29_002892 [Puccinia striiformis f. sp. tritici]|nr:hypothetical protein MJO29_002892 [Puccinia striiformis f. sp. tritici]